MINSVNNLSFGTIYLENKCTDITNSVDNYKDKFVLRTIKTAAEKLKEEVIEAEIDIVNITYCGKKGFEALDTKNDMYLVQGMIKSIDEKPVSKPFIEKISVGRVPLAKEDEYIEEAGETFAQAMDARARGLGTRILFKAYSTIKRLMFNSGATSIGK